MAPIRKHSLRWQRLCNGYSKYWYTKACVRWIALTTAVVDLIVFGATWSDYSNYAYSYKVPMGFRSFAIAAPLFSVVVNVFAIIALFGMRKSSNFNPSLILAGDILAVAFLAVDLAFTGPEFYFETSSWTPQRILGVCWGLSFALGAVHIVPFLMGIWETHVYRGMRREQNFGRQSKVQNLEEDVQELCDSPNTSKELEASTSRNAIARTDGVFRVELPDGRIFELPEGCKVELPADHRVELPEHPRGIFLCELEAPSPTSKA